MVWSMLTNPYIIGVLAVAIGGWMLFKKRRCHQPRQCGRDYPKDTVILHQFKRGPYAPSMSPFCLKLETYLRMANIPYQNVLTYRMGPKGKLPWVEYNGEELTDSSLIIEHFNKLLGVDLNKSLTLEQRATARAFQKMVDEHMYWLAILYRWVYHRSESVGTLTKLPSLVVWEIGRRTKNLAYGQGLGRHTEAEAMRLLEGDLMALSDFLGEKKFMFGDEPNELDCAVLGELAQVMWQVPESCPGRKLLRESLTNLTAYLERMKEKCWPDWDDCITHGFTKEATK